MTWTAWNGSHLPTLICPDILRRLALAGWRPFRDCVVEKRRAASGKASTAAGRTGPWVEGREASRRHSSTIGSAARPATAFGSAAPARSR